MHKILSENFSYGNKLATYLCKWNLCSGVNCWFVFKPGTCLVSKNCKVTMCICVYICLLSFNYYINWTSQADGKLLQYSSIYTLHTHTGTHCVSMFNVCKTLKTGMCTHCCMQFWHAHVGQWTHVMWHMRDAPYELTLGLPHCTCGVATGTVAVGNEMQLFCSWLASFICCNKHCLKVLLMRCGLTEHACQNAHNSNWACAFLTWTCSPGSYGVHV